MKKCFKRALSGILSAVMVLTSTAFTTVTASAAAFTTVGGWNESLYAEWQDSNPDSASVKVGYKLSSDSSYTYLAGDDLTYLVRPASASGMGRVDIPGLKAGRYDLEVTNSKGEKITRTGIKVYANDRSGYAHFNWTEGVGGYKDDGTPKDNAIIVYVTDENKNTVTIPGYGNQTISYVKSTGETWTRDTAGIGDILNNNYNFIKQVTVTDNHPLIIRFIGTVNPPEGLTPHGAKDTALGGSKSDNGNLAITKDSRNITLEGVGPDATIEGWGFTFAKSSTAPADTDKNFEVSNLTFKNYPEDGLAFQGHDSNPIGIERCWVHNNTFYPGYCSNPTESDKKEGDGSCDFKRGQYYTMAYNHYVKCHKTNLLGSGTTDTQWNMTLHHNWYENVGSRQPLAANGNIHIYSTYFQDASSTTVDLRGSNDVFLEENYYDNCKNYFKSRNNTCNAKSYNEIFSGGSIGDDAGTRTVVTSRTQAALKDCGFKLPDGTSMANFDTNPAIFYYDSVNKVSDVSVLTPAAEVPAYVMAHAGTLQPYEETESGEIQITVKSGTTPVTGAKVTASGLTFTEGSNGVYTAVAPLGVAYEVTVSKEGYSNVIVNTTALANDGDIFKANANLAVDTDGYAVVKLEGGTAGAPVIGATVTLNNGTVLVDQKDGTYKSASQLAVGTYTATITNTGDYIAPTSAQTVTVKTTDAETVIKLGKYTGTVNVTLAAADGETEALDASKATVKVGDTTLTYNNGTFTGAVEVGNAYAVTVKMPGWDVTNVTPATITANRTSAVSAKATLAYKGATVMWNHTDGTNTLNATVSANNWSDASSHPQSFEGLSLTKAIKMESSTSIKFTTETDGVINVVAYSTNSSPSIKINGTDYDINASGATEITLPAGTYEIKKGTSSTYLYLIQAAAGGSSSVETSTEATTEEKTEATTEEKTEATTEEKTEATTAAASGLTPLAEGSYNASKILSDSSRFTVTGNSSASEIKINENGSVKFAVNDGASVVVTYKCGSSNTSKSAAAVLNGVTGESVAGGSGSAAKTATVSAANLSAGTYAITAVQTGGTTASIISIEVTYAEVKTTEATTESTTTTTTETTTTTTTTTEATTEATTETPDPGPSPIEGVVLTVGTAGGKVGAEVKIPVTITGISTLASYDVSINYDSSKLTATAVTAGDIITDANALMSSNIGTGKINVTGSNPKDTITSGKVLFYITFKINAEGEAAVNAAVNELYTAKGTVAIVTANGGSVTGEADVPPTPTVKLGDANDDGDVNMADVEHILQYVVKKIDAVVNTEAADVTKDSKVDVTDAYKISRFVKKLISSLD